MQTSTNRTGQMANDIADLAQNMGFEMALPMIIYTSWRIARKGWNGEGMYIALQKPTVDSKMTVPYIYMKTAQGDLVPWLASQSDILAKDWYLVTEGYENETE